MGDSGRRRPRRQLDQAIGTADDFDEADGKTVLDFWQAQDRARVIARAGGYGGGDSKRPATVAEALDRYEADLKTRGGEVDPERETAGAAC